MVNLNSENNIKNSESNWISCESLSSTSSHFNEVISEGIIYNSYKWSVHLENLGWKSYLWQDSSVENKKTYIQSFIKFYPFKLAVVWIPGGVVGSSKNIKSLNQSIRNRLGLNHCYIRMRSHNIYNVKEHINFLINKWNRPLFSLNSNMTMILKISNNNKQILSNFSRNWKRSIKKSSKSKLIIRQIFDPKEITVIYNEMRISKSLKSHEIYDFKSIKSILESFKDNIIVLGAYDTSNKLVAIRGAVYLNQIATDIFAATNQKGKSLSASNGLFYQLILNCREEGCIYYDLNGISPRDNMGVFLFKQGTGAEAVSLVGEFESSTNKLLSLLINLYLFIKRVL